MASNASSVWKGYISFGLVSVPIRLYTAARYSHVAFHEVHRKCGRRVHQQLYCAYDKEVVPRSDIAMGYEVAEDRCVLVDPSELKQVQPKSSTAMEISQFVKLADVDPIFFETSYFSVPEQGGEKAYSLLLKATLETGLAALAKITMHQREHIALLRPYQNGLILHTIYYPNEIHDAKGYGKNMTKNLSKQEVALATQFANSLVKLFHPEQFRDTYSERVKQLIESKSKGKLTPKHEQPTRLAPVIDLMAALKKSLAATKGSSRATKPKRMKKSA